MIPVFQLATGLIQQVNPNTPAKLLISTGQEGRAPDGSPIPAYATPCAFTGSIAGTILTVTAATKGKIVPGLTIAGAGITAGTQIVAGITGDGGAGDYRVSRSQTVASTAITADLIASAQVQDLSQKEVRLFEALNLQPAQKIIYVTGYLSGVVRFNQKGGDIIDIGEERYLTTAVLEQWPTWCKIAATLQNGS